MPTSLGENRKLRREKRKCKRDWETDIEIDIFQWAIISRPSLDKNSYLIMDICMLYQVCNRRKIHSLRFQREVAIACILGELECRTWGSRRGGCCPWGLGPVRGDLPSAWALVFLSPHLFPVGPLLHLPSSIMLAISSSFLPFLSCHLGFLPTAKE